MKREKATASFEVSEVVTETDKAILVIVDGEEVWVPQSQISDDSEVYSVKSGPGKLVVFEWWAKQRGLV